MLQLEFSPVLNRLSIIDKKEAFLRGKGLFGSIVTKDSDGLPVLSELADFNGKQTIFKCDMISRVVGA